LLETLILFSYPIGLKAIYFLYFFYSGQGKKIFILSTNHESCWLDRNFKTFRLKFFKKIFKYFGLPDCNPKQQTSRARIGFKNLGLNAKKRLFNTKVLLITVENIKKESDKNICLNYAPKVTIEAYLTVFVKLN